MQENGYLFSTAVVHRAIAGKAGCSIRKKKRICRTCLLGHVLQQQQGDDIESVEITAVGIERPDLLEKGLFLGWKDRWREGSVKSPSGSVHGQMLPEMLAVSLAPAAWT